MKQLLRKINRLYLSLINSFFEKCGYIRQQPLPQEEGWVVMKGDRLTVEVMFAPGQEKVRNELYITLVQLFLDNQYRSASQYVFAPDNRIVMLAKIPTPKVAEG